MKNKAFTLLELVIVTAIIGLIVTIVLAATGRIRENARDSRRLNEIREIKNALELFFAEYEYYPSSTDSNPVDTGWDESDLGDGFITGLTGSNARGDNPRGIIVMPRVPGDPLGPEDTDNVCSQSYAYERKADSKGYRISVKPENVLSAYPDCGLCDGIYDICFTMNW